MQEPGVKQYDVYVMLSRTHSKFGQAIQRITRDTYSHASIAFDADFKYLFGMGRHHHRVPVVAGLIREYPERFTLKKHDYVEVIIYRIPVTREQYMLGARRVREIVRDSEGYLYNLYSTLTFPVFHGLETYKAYTCSEFVVYLLELMGVELPTDREAFRYTPQQMQELMSGFEVVHKGNLLDYVQDAPPRKTSFFRPVRMLGDTLDTVHVLVELIRRRQRIVHPGRTAYRRRDNIERQKHSAK